MGTDSQKPDSKKTKLNCWEVMACGREAGGEKALESGTCPAAADKSFDGITGVMVKFSDAEYSEIWITDNSVPHNNDCVYERIL